MAKNILVIDDSPSIRALMRLVLEQAGHQVFDAADGEDAYELLDGRRLDLILCDLAMPRMDGMSFLRLLRHHPRYRRSQPERPPVRSLPCRLRHRQLGTPRHNR